MEQRPESNWGCWKIDRLGWELENVSAAGR